MLALAAAEAITARTALGAGGGGGCGIASAPVCTFKGSDAFADWTKISADGCTVTDTSVSAFSDFAEPGRNAMTTAFIGISSFNTCTGVYTPIASDIQFSKFVTGFTGTIAFGKSLSSAAVSGTADMYDANGNFLYTTPVNLSWVGYGPATTMIESIHQRTPGVLSLSTHSNSTSRAAVASGLLNDPSGTNVAASPTTNTQLQSSSGGTVVIVQS